MPRERLQPGEHGRITERAAGGKYYATTYFRDSDGVRRRVERSSDKSAEDARRLLQRHLQVRRPPVAEQSITTRTTLTELFEAWLLAKVDEDGVSAQTAAQYRNVWAKHAAVQLGALRITEVGANDIRIRLRAAGATTQSKRLRMILLGMFAMAVSYEVIATNPVRELKPARVEHREVVKAISPDTLARVRAAVREYADREGSGPRPGRLLPAFVDLMVATGARPNELLATRWEDVDLDADPPTLTITGTLIDHGRIENKALHRQDIRKGGAPAHTVVLPKIGVDVLNSLRDGASSGPVFANREGGWMSLANVRRSLRAALPEDLQGITPHALRRAVASAVRDRLGPEAAQRQLSHSKLSTTEQHYLARHTHGPDVRSVLDEYAGTA